MEKKGSLSRTHEQQTPLARCLRYVMECRPLVRGSGRVRDAGDLVIGDDMHEPLIAGPGRWWQSLWHLIDESPTLIAALHINK